MPATHFPPLRKTLRQLIGPSVLFFALSLSGGELLLWPNLAANVSLNILWAVPVILLLQFIVNIEIERTALVTGRGTEQQLVGHSRFLAVLFPVAILLSLVWPAWMNTAGNIIALLLLPEHTGEILARNVGLTITIALLILTVLLFRHERSYHVLERLAKVALVLVLSIIVFTVATNFRGNLIAEGLRGLFAWGFVPAAVSRFDFLAALAYGGVAGVLNLAQGEWALTKKYGAASLTASEQKQIAWDTNASRKNFRAWFRMINTEHFLIFFCANFFSLFLLSYLGRLLIPLGTAHGFGLLAMEIATLNELIPFLGTLFAVGASIIFIMANITILDAIGRLIHPLLPRLSHLPRIFRSGTEQISSQTISIIALMLGIGILLFSLVIPNFKQPFALLVTSASLSAIVMWIYPPLLLKLNLELPRAARPSLLRIVLLLLCTAFYGAVSLWALSSIFPTSLVILFGFVVTGYQSFVLLTPPARTKNRVRN